MTTRSNTIVRPGGLLRWALSLAALVSLLPLRAADDAPARKVAGELAARFRAMKAYTVTFAVEGDDFAAEGSYAVEGDRYYMRVGDAEAYSDGLLDPDTAAYLPFGYSPPSTVCSATRRR